MSYHSRLSACQSEDDRVPSWVQEKEGHKELKRNEKESKSSAKGKARSDGDAQQRAGLRASYKDIKSMLGQISSGSSDSSEV